MDAATIAANLLTLKSDNMLNQGAVVLLPTKGGAAKLGIAFSGNVTSGDFTVNTSKARLVFGFNGKAGEQPFLDIQTGKPIDKVSEHKLAIMNSGERKTLARSFLTDYASGRDRLADVAKNWAEYSAALDLTEAVTAELAKQSPTIEGVAAKSNAKSDFDLCGEHLKAGRRLQAYHCARRFHEANSNEFKSAEEVLAAVKATLSE